MKIIIVLFLIAIIYSLFSAFYYLAKDKGDGKRMVWSLTWRVGLSMVLLLFMYISYRMGWIEPSSRGPIAYPAAEQQVQE